ncbi:MAG: GNAT family N-acetyltransferase [Betaproteobacteria bacterium]
MTSDEGDGAAQGGDTAFVIDALTAAAVRDRIDELVALLDDALQSNASVGFVLPVAEGELEAFWNEVALDIDDGLRQLLVASTQGRIIGTVMLAPAMKANQPHRADVQKLLVARAWRGRGVATSLMQRVEALAAQMGRWLLTLDTRRDSDADRLYRRHGYVGIGSIPDYATDADRRFASCTFFYKALARPGT